MPKAPAVLCYASLAGADPERVRALFRTLAGFHPDWRFVALADGPLTNGAEMDGIETVTASRSAFLDQACRSAAADIVVHIDPRAGITAPLDGFLSRLDHADILLLARFTEPSSDRQGMLDLDLHVARTGTFNIGLFAVRTAGEGPAFAAWWADRVANYPSDFAPEGYADQRWCDLAPGLFSNVAIVRQRPAGVVLPLDRDV